MQPTIVINNPTNIFEIYVKYFVYNALKLLDKREQYILNDNVDLDIVYEVITAASNKHKTLDLIKTINQAHVINANQILHDFNKLSIFFSSVPQNIKIQETVNFANAIINIKDVHHIEVQDRQTKKIVVEINLKTSQRLYNDTKQLSNFLTEKVLPNYNNLKQRQLIVLLSFIARNAILPVFKRLTPIVNTLKRRLGKEAFTYNNSFVLLENEMANTNNDSLEHKPNSQADNQIQNNNDVNASQEQNIEKTNLFKIIESIIRLIIKVPFFIVKGLVYFMLALIKLDESYIDKFVDYISLAIRKATIPFLVLLNKASLNELIAESRKNDLLTPTEFKNKVNEIKQQINQQANDSKQNQEENQDNENTDKSSGRQDTDNFEQDAKELNKATDDNKKQIENQTIVQEIEQLVKTLKSNVKNTKKQIKKYLTQNNNTEIKTVLKNSIESKKDILADIVRKLRQLTKQENFDIYANIENVNIEDYIFYNKSIIVFENVNIEQLLENIIRRVLNVLIEEYNHVRNLINQLTTANLKSILKEYLKRLYNLLEGFIKRIVNKNEAKYQHYKSYIENKLAKTS